VLVAGEVIETFTDDYGAFETEISLSENVKEVKVQTQNISACQQIHYIQAGDHLIFSDIDDTLLYTKVYHRFIRIIEFLKQDPYRKKEVPELKELLNHVTAISRNGAGKTHFIYVSNSEWNLYPFLQASFEYHNIPNGLFLLSRYRKWTGLGFKVSKNKKKYQRILELLKNLEEVNIYLIGDTGQNDVWHYLKVSEAYPDSVVEVLFRSHKRVEGAKRFKAIEQKFKALNVNAKLLPSKI
jgi:phosphatidate phosphatase APP1